MTSNEIQRIDVLSTIPYRARLTLADGRIIWSDDETLVMGCRLWKLGGSVVFAVYEQRAGYFYMTDYERENV